MRIRNFETKDMNELVSLYQACFAEPPWYERFRPEELIKCFSEVLEMDQSVFLVAKDQEEIIGAAVGFPVSKKPEVAELIRNPTGYYLAELFVRADYRRRHVARELVRKRFLCAFRYGFRFAFVRTSVDQPAIIDMYTRLFGFREVARQNVTSCKVISGQEQILPDTRVILGGNITPHCFNPARTIPNPCT